MTEWIKLGEKIMTKVRFRIQLVAVDLFVNYLSLLSNKYVHVLAEKELTKMN